MLEKLIDGAAAPQLGLITYAQLDALGCSRKTIRTMVATRRLVEIRHHVYVVAGAPRTHDQTIMAAVLAAGKAAYGSHETAAAVLGLPLPGPALLEVTTLLARCPSLPGVCVHRSGRLDEDDVVTVRGIPVTNAARTIVELSSRLSVHELGRMTDSAVRQGLTTLAAISETSHILGKAPGRSVKKVRQMLARRIEGGEARESDLEDFVFDALRRFAIPLPVPQFRVVLNGKQRRIDFCYVDEMLALEPMGFNFHGLRARFDDDAMRGNELVLAGYKVLVFTSAFTDWMIADQVARGLGLPSPARTKRGVMFLEWLALR
ncbi:MAG: type IV toxin-antitoxin system AbiEi family antitoxin domain-containing protein [Actinomycetota bacterium]|nr:type IV toxin-antitoxin system AbiEi family antitoxin domain-containing protein [Actinomycetota bacterium]